MTVEIFGNSKHLRPGPHVAHRGLSRFLHDVAEFAGQRQLAFARHQRGFGRKYLAADLGPCKTGNETDFVLCFVAVRTVLRNTDVVNYIFRSRS